MIRIEPTLSWPSATTTAASSSNASSSSVGASGVSGLASDGAASGTSTSTLAGQSATDSSTLALAAPVAGRDPTNMSPRQLASLSHDLYMEGSLSWDEYKMVGFPSELDPRYDQTIGALTGEAAQPDQSRNMITEWQGKLDFAQRYYPADSQTVTGTQRILNVLSWQGTPKVDLEA